MLVIGRIEVLGVVAEDDHVVDPEHSKNASKLAHEIASEFRRLGIGDN